MGSTGNLSTCAVVTHNDLHLTPLPASSLIEVDRASLRQGGPKFISVVAPLMGFYLFTNMGQKSLTDLTSWEILLS